MVSHVILLTTIHLVFFVNVWIGLTNILLPILDILWIPSFFQLLCLSEVWIHLGISHQIVRTGPLYDRDNEDLRIMVQQLSIRTLILTGLALPVYFAF